MASALLWLAFAASLVRSAFVNPCDAVAKPVTLRAAPTDHGGFTSLLRDFVSDGTVEGVDTSVVDYPRLRLNPSRLHAYLLQLCYADIDALSPVDKTALLCNAYNAVMLNVVVGYAPTTSVLDIPNIWGSEFGTIKGEKVSLDYIEHVLVRGNADVAAGVQGLTHACFTCASASCPSLKTEAFEGGRLKEQLEAGTRTWLATPTKNPGMVGNDLVVSKIFDWYRGDFKPSVKEFVASYKPSGWDISADAQLKYPPYKWGLNQLNCTTCVHLSAARELHAPAFSMVALGIGAALGQQRH